MKRLLPVAIACIALMFSCKGNVNESRETTKTAVVNSIKETPSPDSIVVLQEETPMPKTADELFDDFFFNFVDDDKLQKSRITFPLPILHDGVSSDMIQRADWQNEHFFLEQGYYTLIFNNETEMDLVKDTDVDSVIVEQIFFANKTVKQFFFKRTDKIWKLTAINLEPFSKNYNSSFLSFYQMFATDSVFQTESLHNPVIFSGPDPDDDFERIKGVITPDSWFAFAPELPHTVIYNIVYGKEDASDSNKKIFVVRGISNGEEIEMTFERRGVMWKLKRLDV